MDFLWVCDFKFEKSSKEYRIFSFYEINVIFWQEYISICEKLIMHWSFNTFLF